MVPPGFQAGRDAIKSALDRRYVSRDEVSQQSRRLEALERRLVGIEDEMTSRLEAIGEALASAHQELSRIQRGSAEQASPMEESLRIVEERLRAAERLGDECAGAIERLLQAELILRRDLDSALGR